MKKILTVIMLMAAMVGCEKAKEPQKPAVSPTAPESYMKKPAMTNLIAKARKERGELAALRMKFVEQVKTMVDAARAANPGKKDSEIIEILMKDPEYVSVYKRLSDVTKAINDERKRVTSEARKIILDEGK